MAKKTWKIGEYAKGGVIVTEVKGNKLIVIGKEWDNSAGFTKSSSQENAEEFTRLEVNADNTDSGGAYKKLFFFLTDLTTSYYADKILEWFMHNCKVLVRTF